MMMSFLFILPSVLPSTVFPHSLRYFHGAHGVVVVGTNILRPNVDWLRVCRKLLQHRNTVKLITPSAFSLQRATDDASIYSFLMKFSPIHGRRYAARQMPAADSVSRHLKRRVRRRTGRRSAWLRPRAVDRSCDPEAGDCVYVSVGRCTGGYPWTRAINYPIICCVEPSGCV
jgi:hypothetical protein